MLDLVLSTVSQGLLWAIMALGVFLTFRVLDIADLSVEGTFPLGAAVAATLIDAGHSVWFAMLIALIAGCIGGTVTALLTTKLKIPALLSGILTMIGLYSVNLMIMGKANVPLLRAETVFTLTEDLFGVSSVVATLIVGLIATTVVGVIMYWFFGTVLGTAIRATSTTLRWPVRKASTPTSWSFSDYLSLTVWSPFPAPSLPKATALPTWVWVPALSSSAWRRSLSVKCFSERAALRTG